MEKDLDRMFEDWPDKVDAEHIFKDLYRCQFCWKRVTLHPSIAYETIMTHTEFQWDGEAAVDRPEFTLEHLARFPKWPWPWSYLFEHIGVERLWQWLEANPNVDFNWQKIAMHPSVKDQWPIIVRNMSDEDFKNVAHQIVGFTWDRVMAHPERPWNWHALTASLRNWDMVFCFPEGDWNWAHLSRNTQNMSWDWVMAHLDKAWCWKSLSDNRSLPFDLVAAHPEYPWNWGALSAHASISMKVLAAHPDKAWDWGVLSMNPALSMKLVAAHPDKPWNWMKLSRHGALSWYLITAFPMKPWDIPYIMHDRKKFVKWRCIHKCPFVSQSMMARFHEKGRWVPSMTPDFWKVPWKGKRMRRLRREAATEIIKRGLLRMLANPYTKAGRRRDLIQRGVLLQS